ncbi:hypothetical protein [Novosphingobium cyanobacteriorum]|uniref:Uncharacterized protein n=1 Tax=Novosphingobium cyanobacteriorum TaxID=3024215 RepID=A0ABT6CJD8_9SPHN|nr:hypothetical protein [Novosphingobium cyanobacteriorum]MDF8334001.1 hypothetical protein [Novosphingobium cyanobacteriorum]
MKLLYACLLLQAGVSYAEPAAETYGQDRCGGPAINWIDVIWTDQDLVVKNLLEVEHSNIQWNRTSISDDKFRELVGVVATLTPSPLSEVLFHASANCEKVRMVRAFLDKHVNCATACHEYSEAEWNERYSAPPPPPPIACDPDCKAYWKAGGQESRLSRKQWRRLKKNYLNRYGFIPED